MTQVRLLPTLLIAVTGLLFVKVVHLVANGDMIAGSTTPVLAQEAQTTAPEQGAEGGAEAAAGAQDAALPAGDEPPSLVEGMLIDPAKSSRSELAILERLAKRREELDERAKSLEMREALLKAAEKRLQQRVDELKSLEQSIELATKKRKEQQSEDVARLVAMYESMKASQAAQIFEMLDQDILLDVVRTMKSRKMAAIMGAMDPDKASALSAAIAKGRSLEQEVESMSMEALPQIGN
ncbi:magnesium transporter MgtE N-terminal domain-containing protein [uncultured Cohaesibacter sp.]|uniref:MotE family protein n=1 Tax=uncultured Cohaesibacter sp. TaxID=1002546 RepID=UPI0029305C92|nr:Rnase Y domain-containing protein [uncultured Cohaesibacter sp.]